jgi:hypothetical protein
MPSSTVAYLVSHIGSLERERERERGEWCTGKNKMSTHHSPILLDSKQNAFTTINLTKNEHHSGVVRNSRHHSFKVDLKIIFKKNKKTYIY